MKGRDMTTRANVVALWLGTIIKRIMPRTPDVTDRGAFEAEMVQRGMTRQQAGQAWFDAYFRTPSSTGRAGRRP